MYANKIGYYDRKIKELVERIAEGEESVVKAEELLAKVKEYDKNISERIEKSPKIKELDERLKLPADLDAMEWQISFIQEQLTKANKEREDLTKEQQEALDEQKRKDAASLAAQPGGGGKVPLDEPNKKFVYSSANPYREAIRAAP